MILLYVDDDAEDILLFNEAIEIIGSTYSCITAGNGEKALCILNVVIPDIIFLDEHAGNERPRDSKGKTTGHAIK
jgi:CheY-like chemotaxis protein